jgi:radical SAM superfamily enzyme YgiQ (UPF0313 family)
MSCDIVLATHNARWIHTSFGLRSLRANLLGLRERSCILEFQLSDWAADVVERILSEQPRIVGIGVYVWNAVQALQVVRTLKQVSPGTLVVVGGPEVSHEIDQQEICALADHVVTGEADIAFRQLCEDLLLGRDVPKVVTPPPPHYDALQSPYDEYTDEDIAHRIIYVESSRGCPFTCEFCLSALDVPVRKPELQVFLDAMQVLLDRGVRHFKFVDRTFNLGIPSATAILRFFRERWTEGMFLHFELIPDRLPDALREEIAAMPAGGLQFEIGVQTLDDGTSQRISRRQDVAKLEDNVRWLRANTAAHLHVDLIVGLPGEDEASFARGFDQLWGLGPHEIQVGILKRLRGTPIIRHDQAHGMVYAAQPPYDVLQTEAMPFATMQRLKRFARFWELVANRGNWSETLPLLLRGESPYASFAAFAQWLAERSGAPANIAVVKLARWVWQWLCEERQCDPNEVGAAMMRDYDRCGRSDWPECLRAFATTGGSGDRGAKPGRDGASSVGASRQARHGS